MKNFCFDIGGAYSEKYRLNEIGYEPDKYVSYEKGCYRGQEIIFHTRNEDNHLTHFSVEKSEYYINDMRIIPIANQWDLIQD